MDGKAGLGKSTLMRYICDNEITYQYLKSWAGTFNTSGYQLLFLERRVPGVVLSDWVASLVALPNS
jgi:hypothetical protein